MGEGKTKKGVEQSLENEQGGVSLAFIQTHQQKKGKDAALLMGESSIKLY